MDRSSKIYVAGHSGLVGSALVRQLRARGYHNLVVRTHAELDLTEQEAVREFFHAERPEYIFLAAAKVGGIHANSTYPAEFVYQNLLIETNVIHCAYATKVKKLLFLGSSCIYPRAAPQPMKEEYLLGGPLEPTNEWYAIAKIAGIKLCSAYNRQYGTDFLCVMPTNVYGPGDNYDIDNSHVIPALIRKTHEAKVQGAAAVSVWGTGAPRREFLFSDDLADACVFVVEHCRANDIGEFINVGVGHDATIAETAELIAQTIGFRGRLAFDPSRPDGAPRKLLDIARIRALGWEAQTPLRSGIETSYRDFLGRFAVPPVHA